jgi:hypothetical protein
MAKSYASLACPAHALCAKNKKGQRIEHSEYQPYVEQDKRNIEGDPARYKKR